MIIDQGSIEVGFFTGFWMEFDKQDGNLNAVRLYDNDGNFVEEFQDHKEMREFLERRCGNSPQRDNLQQRCNTGCKNL